MSGSAPRRAAWIAALGAAAVVVVVGFLALGPAARPFATGLLSRRIGAPVRVEGAFSLHPGAGGVAIRFSGLHVGQAAWAGPGDLASVDHGEVDLPWSVLLGDGQVERLSLSGLKVQLKRDAAGRVNWSGGRDEAPAPPRIRRLEIADGVLTVSDAQQPLDFQGAITTTPGPAAALVVAGRGRAEGDPWSARIETPAVLTDMTHRPVRAELEVDEPGGRSAARFGGELFPGGLQGRLQGAGHDLHDLARVMRLPLPRTPDYRLTARVARTPRFVELTAIAGTVGRSDLSGRLRVTPAPGGRRLDGALHSSSLRMADLLKVATGGQLGGRPARPGRLLPDGPIHAAPLRKLTGAIDLTASRVQSATIRSLTLRTTFDRGRVAFDPLDLQLAEGRVRVRFALDARGRTPIVTLDSALTRADAAEFPGGGGGALQAVFDASAHLAGRGRSLAEAAAHANGGLQLKVRSGRIAKLGAAVLSHDLLGGVAALTDSTHKGAAIRCGVARFEVADGVARSSELGLVTEVGAVTGSGRIDLGAETVDITLRPAAARGPDLTYVRLTGPLSHPRPTLQLNAPGRILGGALKLFRPSTSSNGPSAAACG